MHGYVKLEENSIDKALWHRRRVWAVCCALGAGVVVVLCRIAPSGLSPQADEVEDLAFMPSKLSPSLRSPILRGPGTSVVTGVQQPVFRSIFQPGDQYSQQVGGVQYPASHRVQLYGPRAVVNRQPLFAKAEDAADEGAAEAAEEGAAEASAEGGAEAADEAEAGAAEAAEGGEEAAAEEEDPAKAAEEAKKKAADDAQTEKEAAAAKEARVKAAIERQEAELQARKDALAAEEAQAVVERNQRRTAILEKQSAPTTVAEKIANAQKKLLSGKLDGGRKKAKRHATKRKLKVWQKQMMYMDPSYTAPYHPFGSPAKEVAAQTGTDRPTIPPLQVWSDDEEEEEEAVEEEPVAVGAGAEAAPEA